MIILSIYEFDLYELFPFTIILYIFPELITFMHFSLLRLL